MSSEIDTTLSITIGNHELTNLLVQSEVIKVESEIDKIQEQLNELLKEHTLLSNMSAKDIVSLANDQAAKNIWSIVDLTSKVKGQRLLSRKKWSLNFNVSPYDSSPSKDGKIEVGFDISHDLGDEEEILGLEICSAKIKLTDEVLKNLEKIRSIHSDMIKLRNKRDDLSKSVKDTSQIEKRVLASLTKAAVDSNPDILRHLNGVVGILGESRSLMIDSDKT